MALTVAALAYALSPVPDVSQQASQNMTSLKVRDPEGLAQQLSELIRCRTVGNASAPGHVSEHAKSHFLGALQVTYTSHCVVSAMPSGPSCQQANTSAAGWVQVLEESFPAAFRELAVTRVGRRNGMRSIVLCDLPFCTVDSAVNKDLLRPATWLCCWKIGSILICMPADCGVQLGPEVPGE